MRLAAVLLQNSKAYTPPSSRFRPLFRPSLSPLPAVSGTRLVGSMEALKFCSVAAHCVAALPAGRPAAAPPRPGKRKMQAWGHVVRVLRGIYGRRSIANAALQHSGHGRTPICHGLLTSRWKGVWPPVPVRGPRRHSGQRLFGAADFRASRPESQMTMSSRRAARQQNAQFQRDTRTLSTCLVDQLLCAPACREHHHPPSPPPRRS